MEQEIKPVKKRRKKKLPVGITEEEFTNLIRHTPNKKHRLAFLLGFGAGMRVSEVINLQKRHIDFKHKKILIEEGKGGKDRVVPLPKGFREANLAYIPMGISTRALQKGFKNSCRKSGLLERKPTIHFHSLRHGFATRMLEAGVPIHQVQLALGHANLSTTSVYLRANPDDMLKNYEELF